MDRGAWEATVHRVIKESDMAEHLTLSLFESRQLEPEGWPLFPGLPALGSYLPAECAGRWAGDPSAWVSWTSRGR